MGHVFMGHVFMGSALHLLYDLDETNHHLPPVTTIAVYGVK
jgi:hypothetical protein